MFLARSPPHTQATRTRARTHTRTHSQRGDTGPLLRPARLAAKLGAGRIQVCIQVRACVLCGCLLRPCCTQPVCGGVAQCGCLLQSFGKQRCVQCPAP